MIVPPASADEPDTNAAVEKAREAREKYDRGDWAGALGLFEEADAKAHSPVLTLYSARCHRNAGHLLRARELYRRVVDEPLPAGASEPFARAKEDAAKDLGELLPRIPTLKIEVRGGPAAVELDGIAAEVTASGLPVDPGAHVIRALVGGREVDREEAAVPEGKTVTVTLDVAPARAPAPGVPGDSRPRFLGPVGLGLGGAVLAAGVVTRAVAFDVIAGVRDRCIGNECLESDEAEVHRAEDLQAASTACFIAGGALAAAGVVLTIVAPETRRAAAASLVAWPGGLSLTGSF